MAERKKSRRKLDEVEPDKPTKEEYAVAKYLRFNNPVRNGKLVGMEVQCFYANKAIDKLLESKWSASKMKKDPLFTTRSSCVNFCNRLLQKGLFHRAEKVERKKDRDKSKKKKKLKEGEEESNNEDIKEKKSKKDKKGKKETDGEKAEDDEKKDDGEKKTDEKKKKEKRLKLSMHDDQRFVDGEEVYVWIYDPVPVKTFLIGLLMVFGAIGLCLFPLWPEEVRVGVYYISLAAAGFVGFILSLVVVRLVLFCIIWVCTLGKHHFWLLPNLTEDVGFCDSFKPLYKHDLRKDAEIPADKKDKTGDSAAGDKTSKDEQKGKGGEKEESIGEHENGDNGVNGEFEIVEKDDLDEENKDEEMEGENEEDIGERNDSEEDSETKKEK